MIDDFRLNEGAGVHTCGGGAQHSQGPADSRKPSDSRGRKGHRKGESTEDSRNDRVARGRNYREDDRFKTSPSLQRKERGEKVQQTEKQQLPKNRQHSPLVRTSDKNRSPRGSPRGSPRERGRVALSGGPRRNERTSSDEHGRAAEEQQDLRHMVPADWIDLTEDEKQRYMVLDLEVSIRQGRARDPASRGPKKSVHPVSSKRKLPLWPDHWDSRKWENFQKEMVARKVQHTHEEQEDWGCPQRFTEAEEKEYVQLMEERLGRRPRAVRDGEDESDARSEAASQGSCEDHLDEYETGG